MDMGSVDIYADEEKVVLFVVVVKHTHTSSGWSWSWTSSLSTLTLGKQNTERALDVDFFPVEVSLKNSH